MPADRFPGFVRRRLARPVLIPLALAVLALTPWAAWGAEGIEQRRLQIASMSAAEQQDLLQKQQRFSALPLEEQQRLRKLQAELDADPEAQKLQEVLKRYHEWLKTLSPTERAELGDLPAEERVKRIKRIQHMQQAARQAEVLTSKDAREIVRWRENVVWQHREALLKNVPQDMRKKYDAMDEQSQRHTLPMLTIRRRGGPSTLDFVKQDDVEALAQRLSPAAKEALMTMEDPAERRQLLNNWIGSAARRSEPWQTGRKLPPFVENEWRQFIQKELEPNQRQRLLAMPADQVREELRQLYFENRERGPGSSGGPGGGGRFLPPSDRVKQRKADAPPPTSDNRPKEAGPKERDVAPAPK